MIRVENVTMDLRAGRCLVRAAVTGGRAGSLWFDLPEEFSAMVPDRADAFALAMLLPAMRMGEDLHVHGTVTDELLHSLNGPAQQWVRSVLPIYGRTTVSADRATPASSRPPGVATGFSAGVDSYSVIGDYLLDEDVPDSMRVTHLLFNNVGSHDEGHRELAATRLADMKHLAARWPTPVVDVNGNIDEHLAPLGTHTAFQNTHTIRNATIAHLLSAGLGTWYYASTVAFDDVHGGPAEDMGHSDVIGLPLLSTAGLRLVSVGSERTRVEKTLQVAELESARQGLDVCVSLDRPDDRNCSRCWKCLRTLLTLDIAGRLDPFCPARFDQDVYLEHRDAHMVTVLASDDPLHREIVEYAARVGFVWPSSVRRAATAARARAAAVGAARNVKRRLTS